MSRGHRNSLVKCLALQIVLRLLKNHLDRSVDLCPILRPKPNLAQLEKRTISLSLAMLSSVSRKLFAPSSVMRATVSRMGCRSFASAAMSDEYEIIENMRTYPLFDNKVQVGDQNPTV